MFTADDTQCLQCPRGSAGGENRPPINDNDKEVPMTDMINHPHHYNSSNAKCSCGKRIECIDITQHMNFNLGNAMKYIWRQEHKGKIEDLQKAIWYLNCEIRRLQIKETE
jgi:hypothetical protein